MDDTKYVLMTDTREKKQIAHSASKRVGKTGKCTLPTDLMSRKERKLYMAPSEVEVFKLRPMSISEFRGVPGDKKIELLKWYGEKYGWNAAGVAAALDTHYTTGRRILEEFMLTSMFKVRMKECSDEQKKVFMENRRELEEERQKAKALDEAGKEEPQEAQEEASAPAEHLSQPTKEKPTRAAQMPANSGLAVQLKDTKQGSKLIKNLIGFAQSLDEDAEYAVSLLIVQLPPDSDKSVGDVADA